MCSSKKGNVKLFDGFDTLRGAYLAAGQKFFPLDWKIPDGMMFRAPQYRTWIHLATNQRQEDILAFARGILDAGGAYFYKDSDKTSRPEVDVNGQSVLWAETA